MIESDNNNNACLLPNGKKFFSRSVSVGVALGFIISAGYLLFSFEEDDFELEPTLNIAQFDGNNLNESLEMPKSSKASREIVDNNLELEGFISESEEAECDQGLPLKLASKLTKVDQASGFAKNRQDQESQILALNHKHFTLQLLSAKEEAEVIRFIENNNISGKANYYRSKQLGENCYGVLYGSYPTHSAALEAIKSMPDNLKTKSPFIRELKNVQIEIKENLHSHNKKVS